LNFQTNLDLVRNIPVDGAIFICILHHLLVYYDLTKWKAPSWLDRSVHSRALHRYRRGHGFESGLILFHHCLSCLHKCDDQSCRHICFSMSTSLGMKQTSYAILKMCKMWIPVTYTYSLNEIIKLPSADISHRYFLTVRLGGDIFSSEGLVEVYYNKTWGGICDQQWDKQDADVVCRELGFSNATMIYNSGANEGGTIWMNNLQCSGDEMSLVFCVHDEWKKQSCTNGRHAGVVCKVPEGRVSDYWTETSVHAKP